MNPNATVTAPPKTGDEPEAESPEQPGDTEASAEAEAVVALAEVVDAAEVSEASEPSAGPQEPANAHVGAAAEVPTAEPASADNPGASGPTSAPPVPEPRATADPDADADRGKAKKQRKAVRGRTAGGTKSLVVWQQGRVHYADDSVFVLDLDEATSADLDVHELVDRLTELREVLDSPGRSEAVSALVEIIQEKALN